MKKIGRWISWPLLIVAAIASTGAAAEDLIITAGTHYVELPVPIKGRNADKVEVAEFFSYGCPHCYQFEPVIGTWKAQLPADVEFVRTPAVFNKDYQLYAQTYFTAQALNVQEQTHIPLFDALHNQRRRLNDPERMATFFGELGVDPLAFARTYNSFGVRASTQQAEAKGRAYRAAGVPALIVNGKYRIEGSMAGSYANMILVADYLIAKELELLADNQSGADSKQLQSAN
ncbi:MAG: thiol:disulfide interchange protein DsbA [Candidatus Pseudothioglobus sp.]|jgi:thiol:disulfide interchange protein DsbA